MDQSRFVLTDRQWELIAPHCLGRDDTRGSTGRDNRLFLEAVNRPGFAGECLVQLLGRFFGGVQGLIIFLLSFLRRDVADFRV